MREHDFSEYVSRHRALLTMESYYFSLQSWHLRVPLYVVEGRGPT
jgi:hypothetical protein